MKYKLAQPLKVIIFICLLVPVSGFSQNTFYKHMEGSLGEGIHIKADLIRIEKKLSGYYYYSFMDTLQEMDFGLHTGKSMPVSGTINKDNTLEFKEYSSDMEGSVFRGKLDRGVLTGEWVSSDGSKAIPFTLKETYPEGTIAFYVYHLTDTGPLLESSSSPRASIDLTLLLPKSYANAAPVDSANAVIYREFFSLDSAAGDPNLLLEQSRDKFFSNYRRANIDIYENGAASFDWSKSKAVRIQYNENQILSLEFFDYGSTGGAHGLMISKFAVLSLNDGHQIRLAELFREDYSNELRDILNARARMQYDLQEGGDLRDKGFFVENLEPTENFYINKDGIGFYYNQYEVAPFAIGPVDIFIPFIRLKRLINKEGELYRVVEGQ
jgi:hypothetical protein